MVEARVTTDHEIESPSQNALAEAALMLNSSLLNKKDSVLMTNAQGTCKDLAPHCSPQNTMQTMYGWQCVPDGIYQLANLI